METKFEKVSVIIPSYNRGHVIEFTLPSYLQKHVVELILIDDGSTDDTEDVVKKLQILYPQIKYIRNNQNRKQAYSKNVGIQAARGEYIYFGDDDSFLLEGSMESLYNTMITHQCDVVMARALCAGPNFVMEKKDKYIKWRIKRGRTNNILDVYDLSKLYFNWGRYLDFPIEVPCCPACALVKTSLARKNLFDINYVGCAYREETDFFIRLNLDYNAKMIYQPKACQFNLPDYIVKSTGARSGGREMWLESAIVNNKYFLDKNWERIRSKYNLLKSVDEMQDIFVEEMFKQMERGDNSGMKKILKDIYFKLFVY